MLTSRRTSPDDIHIEPASTRLHVVPIEDELPTSRSVTLGAQLYAARKAFKLSLPHLAPIAGVPSTRLLRMESGRARAEEIRGVLARVLAYVPAQSPTTTSASETGGQG